MTFDSPEHQAYLELKRLAYREAGCAVASCLIRIKGMADLPPEDYPHLVPSFSYVTIEGQGPDWGKTRPEWRNLTCAVLILLVGYAAEQSVSPSSDGDEPCWDSPLVRQSLELARQRVALAYPTSASPGQPVSPHIEQNARAYLIFMLDFATRLCRSYSWYIDRVAEALLRSKTLTEKQVFDIIQLTTEIDDYLRRMEHSKLWPWLRRDLEPNLYDLPYVEAQQKKVITVARDILIGQVGVIQGARLLLELQRTVTGDDFDPDFGIFHAICSDTDHLYLPGECDLLAPETRAEMDREIKAWEERYRDDAFAACRKLIARFGKSVLGRPGF